MLNEVQAESLPEFQLPNGRLDKGKYQAYLAAKNRELEDLKPPAGLPSESEFLMIRLVAKISDIGEEVDASQRVMWPPNVDGSIPGHPWGQPWWLKRLVGSYLSGKADAREER